VFAAALVKPYTLDQLAGAIDRALAQRSGPVSAV
jgi:hypothetical protein